ncbi:MAG TPA: SH3-like domain-containing protein [Ensifer sp.]|nr:SH3-like domain-containing protein [Ensifer sp.]
MLPKEMVAIAVATGAPTLRAVESAPQFKVGDEIMTTNDNVSTHTRLPGYARDKRGTIVGYEGAHVFPDAHAIGRGESPNHLYRVRFESETLWGKGSDGPGAVYLSLWETYLVGGAAS